MNNIIADLKSVYSHVYAASGTASDQFINGINGWIARYLFTFQMHPCLAARVRQGKVRFLFAHQRLFLDTLPRFGTNAANEL